MNLRSLTRTALLGGAALLGAATAHAGSDIFWSVGINVPLDPYGATIGTTISNAPRPQYHYRPAPVIVQPAPIYWAPPPPIYYRPAPVYYAPPGYYVRKPPPIRYHPPHARGWDRKHDGRWDRRGAPRRDDRVPYRGGPYRSD